jgi:hypothetical protein
LMGPYLLALRALVAGIRQLLPSSQTDFIESKPN